MEIWDAKESQPEKETGGENSPGCIEKVIVIVLSVITVAIFIAANLIYQNFAQELMDVLTYGSFLMGLITFTTAIVMAIRADERFDIEDVIYGILPILLALFSLLITKKLQLNLIDLRQVETWSKLTDFDPIVAVRYSLQIMVLPSILIPWFMAWIMTIKNLIGTFTNHSKTTINIIFVVVTTAWTLFNLLVTV